MILQFQAMLHLIRLVSVYGNLCLLMNSILVHSTVENMKRLYRTVKKQNTSQVFFIQMTQLNKENN